MKLESFNRSSPTSGASQEGTVLEKDNNAEKNRRQQEEGKTKYEMD